MHTGMVELVRLARGRAASFDRGTTVLNMGLYLGLLLNGDIVSISLGFRPMKLIRWWSGDRFRLTL